MLRRLHDLAAALSLAGDLGHGAPLEHQLRVAVLGSRLAEELGLVGEDRRDAHDVSLLRWLGCTATAQPLAAWMGDEITAHRRAARFETPLDPLVEIVRHSGQGLPVWRRLAVVAGAFRAGPGVVFGSACEAGAHFATRLGYAPATAEAISVAFERFDGRGWPGRLRGDAIPVAARVAMVAEDATTLAEVCDETTAVEQVARRAGRHYDPDVVTTLRRVAGETMAELSSGDAWAMARAADPDPQRVVARDRIRDVLEVVADFVDLKTPGMAAHSRRVAELAAGAGRELGLAPESVEELRHAGLVHDLGRVAISNAVWDRLDPLSSAQWEMVRLHTYHVERFFARSQWLAPLGALAGLHHERLDGSGYHHGANAAGSSRQARVLQAADCFQAMLEPRAHRPPRSPQEAASALRAEGRAGRLHGDTLEAIIQTAGQPSRARRGHPAGLTAREVEVLGMLALGMSNKQIAAHLVVSARTVGHHVAHIYQKAGVATRAGATLFALQHDLVQTSVD